MNAHPVDRGSEPFREVGSRSGLIFPLGRLVGFSETEAKTLGFGSSPISALTPVSATTSLREAGLPFGRRATDRAFSDDRLAVLSLC